MLNNQSMTKRWPVSKVSLDLSYTGLKAMPTLAFELKHLEEFRLGKGL